MAKAKGETSKSSVGRDASPNKNPKQEPPSSSKTYRKSPARTTKSPNRKSPARTTKSPSRRAKTPPPSPSSRSSRRKSPSRKSPARKVAPSRRSPGRPPKVVDKSEPEKPKGSVGRPVKKQVIELDSDSDNADFSHTNVEKPKAAVRGRARRLDSDYSVPKVILKDIQTIKELTPADREISSYIGLVRRPAVQKSSHSQEVERVVHLKHNDTSVQKLTEFSDEDDIPVLLRSSSMREKSEKRYSEPKYIEERVIKSEFGGWIGALLFIFVVPLSIASLYVFCTETQCIFTKLPSFTKYKYFSTYVDPTALFIYSSYALLLATLSALPFGGSKVSGLPNKQGKLSYVMNGLFIALVTCSVLVGLEFYKVPVITYILRKYFQLVVSSLIIGCLFAIYAYVRSFFVHISALNPYAISNSRIYNFWIGREINPRALRVLDIKLFLLRNIMIGMLILNGIFIYKSLAFTSTAGLQSSFDFKLLNPTVLTIASLQIFYALDFLIFERCVVTTFEFQYEATGYMSTVLGFAGPFLLTIITKYVFDHGIKLPLWQLATAACIYFIGYYLHRASNSQKNAFRQNPYSPALSHLESFPTSQGKKLLVSGYWGFVRHPNYLGDILILLSFALFTLNAPPVIICLADVLFLIHRAHRDGARCKQRYGTAWDRYCQRVKYVLIPKIY